VRQSAYRGSEFIRILRVFEQLLDEIPGAHVVSQIAETLIAEGVVSEILDGAAAESIGMRRLQFGRSGTGKTREQERPDSPMAIQID
jgi:hypothetical protein